MVTDCQVSDSGVLLSTRYDTNYQQHFSDTLAFPGGTSHWPSSSVALAEGDGKGGGRELRLLLNFTGDQTRLCVLNLPVVLSPRVPNKPKHLLKHPTDISASMKGSANQNQNKPMRLQPSSDALFTKIWVARQSVSPHHLDKHVADFRSRVMCLQTLLLARTRHQRHLGTGVWPKM